MAFGHKQSTPVNILQTGLSHLLLTDVAKSSVVGSRSLALADPGSLPRWLPNPNGTHSRMPGFIGDHRGPPGRVSLVLRRPARLPRYRRRQAVGGLEQGKLWMNRQGITMHGLKKLIDVMVDNG